jgi:prepilin-type N-terminal cleavage/methylation domain-containing protein
MQIHSQNPGAAINRNHRGGFTLIELLVVIAVIALLISILLPALAGARNEARKLVSLINLKQMATGAVSYATEYKDTILGSPTTSGLDTLSAGIYNGRPKTTPARFNGVAVQSWDWMGPMAEHLGYEAGIDVRAEAATVGDNTAARVRRMEWYRTFKGFNDPAASNILADGWPTGSALPVGRMISYNMSTGFVANESASPIGTGNRVSSGIDRKGYQPSLTRVGSAHLKVAFFEGHRFMDPGTQRPSLDFRLTGADFGGSFSDLGGWWFQSKGINRECAPGEARFAAFAAGQGFDNRVFAFRHGPKKLNTDRSGKAVIGNMAFFDGSGRSFSDEEATNPDFWFPTGTIITNNAEFYNAAKTRFASKIGNVSATNPYIVP